MELIKNCQLAYASNTMVAVDQSALEYTVSRLLDVTLDLPKWDEDFCYQGDPERTLSWIFLFNAINFCYWNKQDNPWTVKVNAKVWGAKDPAFGVMAVLARAIENGLPLDDPDYLEQMDFDDLRMHFYPAGKSGPLPLLELRLQGLKQMGKAFRKFNGAIGLLTTAEFSAPKLVTLLAQNCSSFQDIHLRDDIPLPFLKRAWLCAAMCFERFIDDPSRRIVDPQTIPAFADYRLPQALRGLGVIKYAPALRERIDNKKIIDKGSREELEIRISTLVAIEQICNLLQEQGKDVSHLHLDSFLWKFAVERNDSIPPHHRTITYDY